MTKNMVLTCIVCPNGCEMEVSCQEGQEPMVTGGKCPKGNTYALQELLDPQRTIASSVPVRGGELPLVSVRTDKPIPKARIFEAMREINKLNPVAPVKVGQVLIAEVLGLDCNIIATKEIEKTVGNL